MYTKALEIMIKELDGKTRDDKKTLLSTHCKRVYNILRKYTTNKQILLAGILHDMIEDAGWTYHRIEKDYGKKVADMVLTLSEDPSVPKKDRKKDYIRRMNKADTPTQIVKIADILDNLWDSKEHMPPKYHEALRQYYKKYTFNEQTRKTRIYKEMKKML